MLARSVFTVSDFAVAGGVDGPLTGIPFSDMTMVKTFTGDIQGKAQTRFLGGIDESTSTGGYVAVEHFGGSKGGKSGTLIFLPMQTIRGGKITAKHMEIVPGSGTGNLAGVYGAGDI